MEFAKIVATPTETSWSQVYNAGNLFAVLSLATSSLSEEEDDFLNITGKEVFETLEKEYFALEEKNLASIKKVFGQVLQKIPEGILGSLVVGAIISDAKDILYVFASGGGKIALKRGEEIGLVLDSQIDIASPTSASGFLKDGDIIILQTKQFTEVISESELAAALDSLPPSEIAETLSPKIHEKEEGGASAIVLKVKKAKALEEVEEEMIPKEEAETITQEGRTPIENIPPWKETLTKIKNYLNFLKQNASHPKKVFLTVALILLLVFVLSIFFAVKKKEEIKTQALLQEIYTPAQKKYEEGQALLGLNKNLAREDLLQAQKILIEGKFKFKPNSKEGKQISDLLKKTNDSLSSLLEVNTADAKKVDEKTSPLLAYEKNNPSALFLTQDDKNIYFVSNKEVGSVDKATQKTKTLIQNESHWTTPGGIGTYLGNIYVLDKKSNEILKFVGGTSKTNYLAESADFSNASSIAIDSSIYVLSSNGTIKKFTRGKSEGFSISSLDKPLSKPARIATDVNLDNIYILDNGNGRIVVIDKKGGYQAQYQAEILKDAKDFEVLESLKKIYILSRNKIWEINLK